jgi:hypothetical protein
LVVGYLPQELVYSDGAFGLSVAIAALIDVIHDDTEDAFRVIASSLGDMMRECCIHHLWAMGQHLER